MAANLRFQSSFLFRSDWALRVIPGFYPFFYIFYMDIPIFLNKPCGIFEKNKARRHNIPPSGLLFAIGHKYKKINSPIYQYIPIFFFLILGKFPIT